LSTGRAVPGANCSPPPVPRGLIVAGNLTVALLTSALQVVVLMLASWARGSSFNITATGVVWFVAAVLAFSVFMYSVAEVLANRVATQEEYVGLTPVVAILPWFLAGSLFPISALPVGLAGIARALPTTHVLALLRYGILDRKRQRSARHLGLHQQHRGRFAEPARPGRLGNCHHDCVDAHLPSRRRQLIACICIPRTVACMVGVRSLTQHFRASAVDYHTGRQAVSDGVCPDGSDVATRI
jgi:hypothetical protein